MYRNIRINVLLKWCKNVQYVTHICYIYIIFLVCKNRHNNKILCIVCINNGVKNSFEIRILCAWKTMMYFIIIVLLTKLRYS